MLSASLVSELSSLYRLLDRSNELTQAEIVESEVDPRFLELFDKGAPFLFEPLREVLPSCFQVIQEASVGKCLVVDDLLPGVLLISGAFELNQRLVIASPTLGWMQSLPEWREAVECLPEPLRCFHRFHFNGLHTTRRPGLQMATSLARNLPGAIFKWSNVEAYRTDHRLHHGKFEKMKRALGDLQQIRVWIESDWNDLILINQNSQDRQLYHVLGRNFEDFAVLRNPVKMVDLYCAHVLKGADAPFDFRSV